MNEEQQLKLQAFLDGELPEKDARGVSSWVAQDEEATALLKELRQTRQALKSAEAGVRLPESREFYWSKIQRELERSERVPVGRAEPSLIERLRRVLVPAAAFAVVIAAGVVMFRNMPNGPESEMAVADSGAFTYRDYANGTTLVWVSYPAER